MIEDRSVGVAVVRDIAASVAGWRVKSEWRAFLESGPLAEVWALAQRRELLSALRTQLDPRGERMSVMSTANWVRSGRTPREHQVRYDRFVGVATNVFDEGELSMRGGTGRYVNEDPLPDWLDLIASGASFASASQRIVDREYEQASRRQTADGPGLSHRIRESWRTVTNRWQVPCGGFLPAVGRQGSYRGSFTSHRRWHAF